MPLYLVLAVLAVLAIAGYRLGRGRAYAVAGGEPSALHSLPSYHGAYVVLWCLLPALALVLVWTVVQPLIAERVLVAALPESARALDPASRELQLSDLRNVAAGDIASRELSPELEAAASRYAGFQRGGRTAMFLATAVLAVSGAAVGRGRIEVDLRARNAVERVARAVMFGASAIAILITIGIVLSLLFEALRFFKRVPLVEFLVGTQWSPQTSLRADQVGSSGAFGAVPVFAGTALITLIAMMVAVPIGLFAAIYMSEYATSRVRAVVKPLLEVLAGIPTVVYGFFAALTVAPWFRGLGEWLGQRLGTLANAVNPAWGPEVTAALQVSSESALAAGTVMGVMIIPFVSSLSDDVINAVPQALRDGSYALGATKSETIKQVVLPAALPGIVGSVLLAISRAIGETMIVVMAAGLAANLTWNPLEAVTTVTVQIVTLLVGDQEFDSAKTLAAFALGLVLFLVTLGLNIYALRVVRKYREQYE